MQLCTVDGLLIETVHSESDSPDVTPLRPEVGPQLVSLYRLFLRLHHASDTPASVHTLIKNSEASSGAGDDGREVRPRAWETETMVGDESAQAALSGAPVPYPIFLLPSAASPDVTALCGFPSYRKSMAADHGEASRVARRQPGEKPARSSVISTILGRSEWLADGAKHMPNPNRCANGAEEIPIRCGLASCGDPAGRSGEAACAMGACAPVDAANASALPAWASSGLRVETSLRCLYCLPVELNASADGDGPALTTGLPFERPVVFVCGSSDARQ